MTVRDRWIQAVCVAVLAVCVAGSGVLSVALTAEAGASQLTYTDEAAEGEPGVVALGIALGAFRGLFVNYLWLRANALKEEGKFYEAVELSSTITRLQPRFPRVWAFHAWNMAYNISVATQTAEERWQWVKAGIELLRQRGIPMNPNDPLLHKELAWIFVHKVQGFQDDANRYYKRRLAEEWQVLLGEPPRMTDDHDAATEAMVEWFGRIARASGSVGGIARAQRAAAAAAEGVEPAALDDFEAPVLELVRRLDEEVGFDVVGSADDRLALLRLVAYLEAYRSSWYAEAQVVQLGESRRNEALEALYAEEAFGDSWERLLAHLRRRVVVEEYRMEPSLMLEYIRRYGPLDFRHPAAHSLYWATKGVEEGLERRGIDQNATINTDRLVFHSLQELWRSGTIFYDLVTDEYITLQNLAFTQSYGEVFDLLGQRGGFAEDPERAFTLYRAGYENFLREVIRAYYRRGEIATARDYREQLITWEGRTTNDPRRLEDDANLSLDEFVLTLYSEDRTKIPYVYRSEVQQSLRSAFLGGLLENDRDRFRRGWEYARSLHEFYFREQVGRTTVDARTDRMEALPREFIDIAAITFVELLLVGADALQGSRMYRGAPVALRRATYDRLARYFASQGMTEQVFDRLFPEPEGMAEYREMRRRMQEQSDRALQEQLRFRQQ